MFISKLIKTCIIPQEVRKHEKNWRKKSFCFEKNYRSWYWYQKWTLVWVAHYPIPTMGIGGQIIPTTLQLAPPPWIFKPSYGPDHQSSSSKTEQQQFQYCSSPFQKYSSFLPTYSILLWFIIIMVPNPAKLTVQWF